VAHLIRCAESAAGKGLPREWPAVQPKKVGIQDRHTAAPYCMASPLRPEPVLYNIPAVRHALRRPHPYHPFFSFGAATRPLPRKAA
jgi:hypothetical protein